MSTKIYDGCKFKVPPKNLKEMKDIIFKFKDKAIDYYHEKYLKLLARDITFLYDEAMTLGEVQYVSPDKKNSEKVINFSNYYNMGGELYHVVMVDIREKSDIYRENRNRYHRFENYGFYFTLTAIPCDDEVCLLPFSEEINLKKILKSMDEIEEYFYWNNTDKPEDISDKEWDKRRKIWDEALPGAGVPSECGFSIDIVNSTFDIMFNIKNGCDNTDKIIDEVFNYIPDFEIREKRIVDNLLEKKWSVENKEKTDKLAGDIRNWELFQELRKEFKQYQKENPEVVEKIRVEVSKKLKKDFTIEDYKITCKDFCERYNIKPIETKKDDQCISL